MAQLRRHRPLRSIAALATIALLSLSAVACSSDDGGDAGGSTKLTMWVRASMEAQAIALTKAFNDKGGTQIDLTVVPTDDYQAKVGAAAGSKDLPDLFAADIVYMPNYTSSGLLLDITDKLASLSFTDDLAQGHIKAGTYEGKQYVVPFIMDLSVFFYNKDLYTQAGLDPEQPPTTMAEYTEHATKIRGLGGDTYGTFFGANCPGCGEFTWWPSIWADGEQVMNDDGTEALLDSETAKGVYAEYRKMVDAGAVAPGFKDETGATWTAPFAEGNIGVMPMPSTTVGLMPKDLNFGVSPLVGVKGGESTFVGGDGIGIAATTEKSDAAWEFIEWMLGDEAQVEVLAKGGDVVARADLAENKYASVDERLVTINKVAAKGETPMSTKTGEAINDPNGPWLKLMRDALFGDASLIDADNDAISKVLKG